MFLYGLDHVLDVCDKLICINDNYYIPMTKKFNTTSIFNLKKINKNIYEK